MELPEMSKRKSKKVLHTWSNIQGIYIDKNQTSGDKVIFNIKYTISTGENHYMKSQKGVCIT